MAAETKLKEELDFVDVVAKENAKGTYETSVVVDLSGSYKEQAEALSKSVAGSVGSLPEEETRHASADIAIFLGNSYPR